VQLTPVQVVLIEASPRRANDGVVETLRLAGGGAVAPYRYSSQDWRAGVVEMPSIEAALEFRQQGWTGGATPQTTDVEWYPAAGMDAAAGYFWPDAAVTIYTAPDGGTPVTLLVGKVANASADASLKLTIADPSDGMNIPVLTDRFLGTGGVEGPTEWSGKIKRRGWGRVWNVEGEAIDTANNVWSFADPTKKWQSIDAVRDKGGVIAIASTIAFTSTPAATLAALAASSPPAGQCIVAPSIACVKHWTQPIGPFTVDAKGEIGSAYVETVPEIMAAIVAARSGPAFVSGTVAAATAIRGGAAGVYIDSESETLAGTLDRELAGVSLLWVLEPVGTIRIRPWAWGTSVASLTSVDAKRNQTFAPSKGRTVGYKRNRRVQSTGEILASVLYSDIEGTKPDADATNANNLQLNSLLSEGTEGYNFTSGNFARAAGTNGPPAAWVLACSTTTIGGGGQLILPKSKVAGGRRIISSIWVMRTAGLSALTLSANCFNALTGAGIGPVGGAISIVPSAPNVWQRFSVPGLNDSAAGSIGLTVEGMAGNAGRVEVALGEIFYDLATDTNVTLEVPPLVTIKADYAGTALAGQLPRTLTAVRRKGTTDVSATTVWANTASASSTITGGTTASVTITACAASGRISWSSARDGVTLLGETTIVFDKAAPPSTSGGGGGTGGGSSGSGSPGYDTSIAPTSSGSYGAANAGPLTVTVGSSGTVNLTAPLGYTSTGSATNCLGKWQWRVVGGTFADVASEIAQTLGASGGDDGQISVAQSKTGLTSGTAYEFQLLLRRGAGTGTLDFYGTATASPT